VKMKVGHL